MRILPEPFIYTQEDLKRDLAICSKKSHDDVENNIWIIYYLILYILKNDIKTKQKPQDVDINAFLEIHDVLLDVIGTNSSDIWHALYDTPPHLRGSTSDGI